MSLPVLQPVVCTAYGDQDDPLREVLDILRLKRPGRLLSFGCATGEEVRSLKQVVPEWEVHGVEIDDDARHTAQIADPEGLYAKQLEDLPPGAYDVIVAVSVLCWFPATDPVRCFPFSLFERAVVELDLRLIVGGIALVRNAQYDWRDAVPDGSMYEGLPSHIIVGFVPVFYSDGTRMSESVVKSEIQALYRKTQGQLGPS